MKTVLDYLDKRIEETQAMVDTVEKEGKKIERAGGTVGGIHRAVYNQLLGALIELKRARGEILSGNVKGFEP